MIATTTLTQEIRIELHIMLWTRLHDYPLCDNIGIILIGRMSQAWRYLSIIEIDVHRRSTEIVSVNARLQRNSGNTEHKSRLTHG